MEPNQTHEKTNGALIGSIIIIVILIIGGVYLLKRGVERPAPVAPSGNADYSDMEADLNNVELENIDQEI